MIPFARIFERVMGRVGDNVSGQFEDILEMGYIYESPPQLNQVIMRFNSHKELNVYKNSIELALRIHELSKKFPPEEKYSLTDQIRRSSRSVASNIAEAYRKRRYPKHFISKLSDSEGEIAETQVWLYFTKTFGYLESEISDELDQKYEHLIAQLVTMIQSPEKWTF